MRSSRTRNVLFLEYELRTVMDSQEQQMVEAIDSMDTATLLNTSVDSLCDYYESEYKVEIPELQLDDITVEQAETRVDISQDKMRNVSDRSRPAYVPGVRITFSVPFDGDTKVFNYRPSTFSSVLPRANVRTKEIDFPYDLLTYDATAVRSGFDRDLMELQKWLGWITKDATPFNASLRDKAKRRIEHRRERLLNSQGLVASLGFPLKKRSDSPQTYVAPEIRRKPPVSKPSETSEPFVPEPTLDMQEYGRILSIISSMTSVIERSPQAFREMSEEDLRQHFLVQLNGHYEGQASGETFNFEGKTDILIRVKNKNVFIGECKFWRGPKSLRKTLDQVLGYSTWRDTKIALLVFNRNKTFSATLDKIPETVREHPNYRRELEFESESGFRYILHHRDDPRRELILTIMAFEVPS